MSARLVTVQEEERRSLRELHDEVGQALTALKMDVTVARRGVDALQTAESGARIVSWLDDARSIAENTLQSVRISQLLHPSMLDDFGLPEALRSYLRTFSKRTGISAQFIQNGKEQRLPQAMEVCLYRIVQEALTNVVRHSGARNAIITLSQTDNGLEMTIDDDGNGIDQQISRFGESFDAWTRRDRHARARISAWRNVRIGIAARGGTRVAVHLPAVPDCRDLYKSDSELLAG